MLAFKIFLTEEILMQARSATNPTDCSVQQVKNSWHNKWFPATNGIFAVNKH